MNKTKISIISLLCILATFSIGYANWTITNNAKQEVNGLIQAEKINDKNIAKLIDVNIDNEKPPFIVGRSGFNINEELKQEVNLSFKFAIDNKTVETNKIIYECRLSFSNLTGDIETKLENFTATNATIDTNYNNGFGPYAQNKQEHISHVIVDKSLEDKTIFTMIYTLNNFSDLINQKDLKINIRMNNI